MRIEELNIDDRLKLRDNQIGTIIGFKMQDWDTPIAILKMKNGTEINVSNDDEFVKLGDEK